MLSGFFDTCAIPERSQHLFLSMNRRRLQFGLLQLGETTLIFRGHVLLPVEQHLTGSNQVSAPFAGQLPGLIIADVIERLVPCLYGWLTKSIETPNVLFHNALRAR